MVTKNQIKLIKSLSRKKNRDQNKLFVVEGTKSISEFLKAGFKPRLLFATHHNEAWPEHIVTDERELRKISFLKNPSGSLAVFEIPETLAFEQKELTLVLDGIQDPGNLGTIIRLCDWFGIEFLVCSRDTADCFNPKVVQSSMGSLARVEVVYTDLKYFLKEQQAVSYGALLEGENVYQTGLSEKAVLVMGNEGKGISPEIAEIMDKKIHIPQFGVDQETESLNVGTATAILLSEFRRGRFTGKQN